MVITAGLGRTTLRAPTLGAMTALPTRTLGDLSVSALGVGAMILSPGMYGEIDDDTGEAALRAAVDAGATLVDTSDGYRADAATLRRAHAVHPVSAVQTQWAMWHRPDPELVEAADELGVGIVAWSPLGSGFLTGAVSGLAEGDFRNNIDRFAHLAANNDRY